MRGCIRPASPATCSPASNAIAAISLRGTVKFMAENGGGVLLYLDQEGRGNGIANKIRAYRLQHVGYNTFDADGILGFDLDQRQLRFRRRHAQTARLQLDQTADQQSGQSDLARRKPASMSFPATGPRPAPPCKMSAISRPSAIMPDTSSKKTSNTDITATFRRKDSLPVPFRHDNPPCFAPTRFQVRNRAGMDRRAFLWPPGSAAWRQRSDVADCWPRPRAAGRRAVLLGHA